MQMQSTGSGKDAFGQGLGLAHEFGLALGDERITPSLLKLVVSDPSRRATVATAIRGELKMPSISPEHWIERELAVVRRLIEFGLPEFDLALVEKAAVKPAGIHSRFVPGGMQRYQLLEACAQAGLKLYNNDAKAADCDGEEITTVPCVSLVDYGTLMKPTNKNHHPFMLDYDQQWAWAREQGGRGFCSAEQTIYLAVLRPWIECDGIPYMGGSIRCRNARGSDDSLCVSFNADYGLYVSYYGRSGQYWNLWALPEVSLFYFKDLIHPPNILPISCSFSSKDRYLLVGNAFISLANLAKSLSRSNLIAALLSADDLLIFSA